MVGSRISRVSETFHETRDSLVIGNVQLKVYAMYPMVWANLTFPSREEHLK